MKTKLLTTALVLIATSVGLSACSSSPAEKTYDGSSDSSQDQQNQEEEAYVYSDENSVIKTGENGVETITVTLNDGTKVECVRYATLVCFPELAPPR